MKEKINKKPINDVVKLHFYKPVSAASYILDYGRISIIIGNDRKIITPESVKMNRMSVRGNLNAEKHIISLYIDNMDMEE